MYKLCAYCNTPIGDNVHGNSIYCSDDCYYLSKLKRQRERYATQSELTQRIKYCDSVLQKLYRINGPDVYIPALKLEDLKMDWNIRTGVIQRDGLDIHAIGAYGYVLFKNKTVRIWKIK